MICTRWYKKGANPNRLRLELLKFSTFESFHRDACAVLNEGEMNADLKAMQTYGKFPGFCMKRNAARASRHNWACLVTFFSFFYYFLSAIELFSYSYYPVTNRLHFIIFTFSSKNFNTQSTAH